MSQLNIAASEEDFYTMGMINDMYTEMSNDEYDYPVLATQDDFDKF